MGDCLRGTAATTAILSLLTAGAAAAIGPMAGAANVAYRAARATRIAARLADIAKRTQALAKLSRLRRYLRGLDRAKIKEWKGARRRIAGDLLHGNRPSGTDVARFLAWKQGKKIAKGVLGVDPGGALTGAMIENGPALAEETVEYETRPEPKSFDACMDESPAQAKRSVREAFG